MFKSLIMIVKELCKPTELKVGSFVQVPEPHCGDFYDNAFCGTVRHIDGNKAVVSDNNNHKVLIELSRLNILD